MMMLKRSALCSILKYVKQILYLKPTYVSKFNPKLRIIHIVHSHPTIKERQLSTANKARSQNTVPVHSSSASRGSWLFQNFS